MQSLTYKTYTYGVKMPVLHLYSRTPFSLVDWLFIYYLFDILNRLTCYWNFFKWQNIGFDLHCVCPFINVQPFFFYGCFLDNLSVLQKLRQRCVESCVCMRTHVCTCALFTRPCTHLQCLYVHSCMCACLCALVYICILCTRMYACLCIHTLLFFCSHEFLKHVYVSFICGDLLIVWPHNGYF